MDVELGFLEEVDSHQLEALFFPSKVGGKPAWLSQSEIPSDNDLKCSICGDILRFLIQIYAPREDKDDCFHRTIYVFCCSRDECFKKNSSLPFKVFRNQIARRNPYFDYDPVPDETDAVDIKLKMGSLRDSWGCLCEICGCCASKRCARCHIVVYCCAAHQLLGWKEGHKNECATLKDSSSGIMNSWLYALFFCQIIMTSLGYLLEVQTANFAICAGKLSI